MISQLIELATTLLKTEEEGDDFLSANQVYTILLYMTITKEQEMLLAEDPNQFISDEDNEFAAKDLKSWANDFMNEVIDQHEDKIPLILQAIERLLVRNQEQQSQAQEGDLNGHFYDNKTPEFGMKWIESGLFWLGNLPDGIWIEEAMIDDNTLTIIENIVIPILENPSEYPEYIQLRALWVLKQKKNIIKVEEAKTTIFKLAANIFMNTQNLAIKLIACPIFQDFQASLSQEEAEALLNQLLKIIEVANVETLNVPLQYLTKLTKDTSVFNKLINGDIINGILTLFQKNHIDPFVGDDFCELLKSWIHQNLALTSSHVIPFVLKVITNEHEVNSRVNISPNDEVSGTAIFDYSLKLAECVIEVSNTVGKLSEDINYEFFQTISQILIETQEIFIQTTLLGFYKKLVNALGHSIQGSEEAIGLIEKVIQKYLDINQKVYERGILYIGEVVVVYLSSFTPTPVQNFVAMAPWILERLHSVSSSNILESLLYPFLYMCLNHHEETLANLEERNLQIFVDNLVNYAERGAFRNKDAKNMSLKIIAQSVISKITPGGARGGENLSLCTKLPQIREYPPVFAFILMLWRMVERQSISEEFDEFGKYPRFIRLDSFCKSFIPQNEDITFEKQCLDKVKHEIRSNESSWNDLKDLLENVQPKESELIKKYIFEQ